MATITTTESGAVGRYVNLGTPASQNDVGAQTIIAYCKPTAGAGEETRYILGKTPSGSPVGLRMWLGHNAGTPLLGFGVDSSGTASPSGLSYGNTAITYGTWHHLEVTWDGTTAASSIKFYIGGVDNTHISNMIAGAGSVTSDATLGLFLLNRGDAASLARDFIGDVGYIARWSRVLDSTERASVRTDGPMSVPTGLILCWANNQDYSTSAVAATARSTLVAGGAAPNTALGTLATDTTAPTLTSPTGTATTSTTASGGVTTDEANGTLYALASTNTTESAATVKASPLTQAVTASGAKTVSFTGLTASTTYYAHYVHRDAAGNDSVVSNSASFTTSAGVSTIKGARITLYNSGALQASLSGIRALWWDATDPSGAPAYGTATATTDASGILTINIDASTALAIGASGFLLLYKLNVTDHKDSLVFAGQVAVSDIA